MTTIRASVPHSGHCSDAAWSTSSSTSGGCAGAGRFDPGWFHQEPCEVAWCRPDPDDSGGTVGKPPLDGSDPSEPDPGEPVPGDGAAGDALPGRAPTFGVVAGVVATALASWVSA